MNSGFSEEVVSEENESKKYNNEVDTPIPEIITLIQEYKRALRPSVALSVLYSTLLEFRFGVTFSFWSCLWKF